VEEGCRGVKELLGLCVSLSRLVVGEYVGTARFKLELVAGTIGLCTGSNFHSLQKYDSY
jgi:hypothetical protein